MISVTVLYMLQGTSVFGDDVSNFRFSTTLGTLLDVVRHPFLFANLLLVSLEYQAVLGYFQRRTISGGMDKFFVYCRLCAVLFSDVQKKVSTKTCQ